MTLFQHICSAAGPERLQDLKLSFCGTGLSERGYRQDHPHW